MNASSESGLWATVILVSDMVVCGCAGSGARNRMVSPQAAHDGSDTIDREIDVGVGRPASEAESDRGAGALADRPDGDQHVRRSLTSRAAGGTGGHGDIAERHEERLALDSIEADVQVVREPSLERSVDADAIERGLESGEQPIPGGSQSRRLLRQQLASHFRA